MKYSLAIVIAALCSATPALAGASSFTVVNRAGSAMTDMSIRRFGTQAWQTLKAAPASGATAAVTFSDPDCAFDIRATLAGGSAQTWEGVNLCDAKIVTLNRAASGELWVDYE